MSEKRYDFKGTVEKTYASAAAIAVKVEDTRTIVTIDLAAASTISLDAASKPTPGDEIIFKISSDGTGRDATFGTGFTGAVLSGTANKTKTKAFVYTEAAGFIAVGEQIN